MADTNEVDALQVWSLATFRTTTFMIAIVIWQYSQGSLQEQFNRLGTGIGFLLFGGLWACTWLSTRWGLRAQADLPSTPQAWGPRAVPTIVAGGWNGLLLLVPLVAVFLISIMRAEQMDLGRVLVLLVLSVGIGGAVAFAIGALVGFVYSVAEALLLGLGDRVYQWATRG